MTHATFQNIDKNQKRGIDKYIEFESPGIYNCKPILQQIFFNILSLIKGSQNPLEITNVFRKSVPVQLRTFFERQLFFVGGTGHIILLGLPKECALENSFSAGLTSLVSFPVCYPGEGALVISIKPQRVTASNPSFANAKEFGLHTDLSYTPVPPDILTMVVKNIAATGGGDSLLASVDDVHTLVSHEIYHQLRQPQFHFAAPEHYKTEFGKSETGLPIINHTDNGLRVRFRYDKVTAETTAGREAIEVFKAMIDIKAKKILLPQYSGIFMNQRYYLHGRTEFIPTFDENDRELTRSYGTICPQNFNDIDYETGIVQF